jgi:hypothetical protein
MFSACAARRRTICLTDSFGSGVGGARSRWWTPESPKLFDVEFTLVRDGRPIDQVRSYFGIRFGRQRGEGGTGQAPNIRSRLPLRGPAYSRERIRRNRLQENVGGRMGLFRRAKDEADFIQRLADVVHPLLRSPVVKGFCYTQLTDVEQEMNGLMTYDRKPKLPFDIIKQINNGKLPELPS